MAEWTKAEARLVHQALELWGVCRGAIWEQYYLCFADRPADLVLQAVKNLSRRKKLRPAPAEIGQEMKRIRGERPRRCRFCRGRQAVRVDVWRAATPELSGLIVPPGAVYEIPRAPDEFLVRAASSLAELAGRRTTVLLYCGRCAFRQGAGSLDDWIRRYDGFFEPSSAQDAEVIDERRRILERESLTEDNGKPSLCSADAGISPPRLASPE